MPTLPIYNSNRNIEANIAAPVRNEVAQPFQDFQKVVGTVAGVTEQWSQANDVMQYNKAHADYEVKVDEIQMRAAADPNYNNSEKYQKELDDAKSNSIAGISNKEVANRASLDFDYRNRVTAIRIDSGFKKKQLAENKFNVETLITSKTNQMAGATEAEKAQLQADIDMQLKMNVKTGVLSSEEAYDIILKSKTSTATAGIFTDPDGTITELKKDDGFYKEIPVDKRMTLIERGIDYKAKLERQATQLQKDLQADNETNIAVNMAQGNFSDVEGLATMVSNGQISSDFATMALKVATSKETVDAVTNNEDFSNLTTKIFASKDKEQIRTTVNSILKGGGDGKLSKDDTAILLQSAKDRGANFRQDISDGVKSLGDWADTNKKVKRADMYRDYQKLVTEGKTPQEAVLETIKINTLKVRPDFLQFPAEGKIQVDKYGNKAKVFPDGHIEEIK